MDDWSGMRKSALQGPAQLTEGEAQIVEQGFHVSLRARMTVLEEHPACQIGAEISALLRCRSSCQAMLADALAVRNWNSMSKIGQVGSGFELGW